MDSYSFCHEDSRHIKFVGVTLDYTCIQNFHRSFWFIWYFLFQHGGTVRSSVNVYFYYLKKKRVGFRCEAEQDPTAQVSNAGQQIIGRALSPSAFHGRRNSVGYNV